MEADGNQHFQDLINDNPCRYNWKKPLCFINPC